MDLKMAFRRARRGLREDFRLYVVAVSSLTVAFLCLAAALLAMTNLDVAASRWGQSTRMTLYLRDGASARDVQQLSDAIQSLPEVGEVEHVTAAQAREQFLRQSDVGGELSGLPPDVFPASLELTLAEGTSAARAAAIAERLGRFRSVEDVETYKGWFDQLSSLMVAGRGLALVLAILVLVCVVAVVGNTIRLAVAGRRLEIEVMKLCGATDTFVRRPFVVEGALQGFAAAMLALILLLVAFLLLRGPLDSTLAAFTGVQSEFLDPLTVAALLAGGAVLGAMGSALSLRRYLTV